jgi:hypothetical protein
MFTDWRTHVSEGKESGVEIKLPLASDGIRIVDNYLEIENSTFIQDLGVTNPRNLPCSFCFFLKDGRFFGSQNGFIYFWGSGGDLLWKKEVHVHHDIFVDEELERIFLVSGDLEKIPGKIKQRRADVIRGLNFQGEEIFAWKILENKLQYESILRKKLKLHENSSYFEFSHFNSVQEIPHTKLTQLNGAFKKGNILVNDFWNYFAFIIDKDTKKIVWHTRNYPKQLQIHGLRLLKSGEMIFFRNSNHGVDPAKDRSSIDFMDPISGNITHSIILEPPSEYYSKIWSSLQVINENRFLVTYSENGVAVELDRNGKIYWKWRNPNLENGKPKPIYRVSLVNREGFSKSMIGKK